MNKQQFIKAIRAHNTDYFNSVTGLSCEEHFTNFVLGNSELSAYVKANLQEAIAALREEKLFFQLSIIEKIYG